MREEITSIRMLLGFFAGFIAVLAFQQPPFALFHALGFTSQAAYSGDMTLPLGVPYVWAEAFWGGVFGIILGGIDNRFPSGARFWRAVTIYGAVAPTVLEWILTLALRHAPLGGVWTIGNVLTPFIANAAWGVGAEAILSALFLAWRIDLTVWE